MHSMYLSLLHIHHERTFFHSCIHSYSSVVIPVGYALIAWMKCFLHTQREREQQASSCRDGSRVPFACTERLIIRWIDVRGMYVFLRQTSLEQLQIKNKKWWIDYYHRECRQTTRQPGSQTGSSRWIASRSIRWKKTVRRVVWYAYLPTTHSCPTRHHNNN